ncbi:hypothetical protein ACJJTC_000632 [Scirpophaga incertulas]
MECQRCKKVLSKRGSHFVCQGQWEYGFTKCINDITRKEILNGKSVESCIDHIYLRDPLANIYSCVIKQKISDHYFVVATVQWKHAPGHDAVTVRRRRARGHPGDGAPAPSLTPTPAPALRRVLDNRLLTTLRIRSMACVGCSINSRLDLCPLADDDLYVNTQVNMKRALDFIISELWAKPYRKFTFSDMPYFFHWWANRDETGNRI